MSRVMNLLISFLAICFLNSCNQFKEKSQVSMSNKDTIISDEKRLVNLDSLSIKYWKATEANEYYFKYSNGVIQVSSQYSSLNKTVSKEITVKKFINYIDAFFIDKTQEIEFSKLKCSEPIVTDYSVITIQGYRDRREIINQKIQIGEESYKIKFNPKFIEFIEFLEELTLQK